jgi:hypothetical protein
MKCNLVFLALSALTWTAAQASVTDMVGRWNGTGTTYSLQGDNQGTYAVQLTDTLQQDGSVTNVVDVAVPGSPNKEFDYVLRGTKKGFSMTSAQSSGGATCLDKGLCEGYFGDTSGNGVAITFIFDGPNNFRALKTELQGFQATRFFLEKYTRAETR